MTFPNFIKLLKDSNVNLSLDKDENIRISAPKGILKQEHRDALKRYKPNLVDYLKNEQLLNINEPKSVFSQERHRMGYKAPCSAMQNGMWLSHQLQSDSTVYNMSGAFEIMGGLKLPLLEQAFNQLVHEHDVLRTRFKEENEQLWQCIEPKFDFKINVVESTAEKLNDEIQKEASHIFNLEKLGLIRAVVFRLKPDHHILVLTLHHIIADGWSIQLLVKQLNSFYSALLSQSEVVPNKSQLQYADFTQWQLVQIDAGLYQDQLDYWAEKLADQPPLLNLPTDRPRPAKQDFSGDTIKLVIPQQLKSSLDAVCKQHDVTMYMLLLAGFKVLLARYSNINDLSIGTPVANRTRSEFENVLGMFVNTVVVRSEIESDISFVDYLNSIKETSLSAFANSQIPFDQVVTSINPERSASFHPLCQVFFSFQHQTETQIQLGDLSCHRLPSPSQGSRVDLTLMLNASDQEITGNFEYATALFDRTTIEHLIESYIALLASIATNSYQKINKFKLLSEKQQHLLKTWQGYKTQYPERIDSQISIHASNHPDAIAVTYDDQQMTYAELENYANRLANNLLNTGVKKGTLVGALLRPCLELPGVLLAILKAGCSYVPLDPSYPENRLQFMIDDSGVNAILGQGEFKNQINSNITFHDIESLISQSNHSTFCQQYSKSDLLCLKYTSGSTGIPKGVRLSHQNILRLVVNSDLIELNHDTVMLHYASLSFDASALEIWGTLVNGGHLIIADPKKITPATLSDYLTQHPINTAFFTTSLFNELYTHHAEVLSELNLIMAGGEAFKPEHAQKISKQLPRVKIINGYGPTENGVFSCCHLINPFEDYRYTVPIGKCVNNSTVYVLDENLNVLPCGAVGEIWVGGEGLAEGYHNNAQLTSERFIWHDELNQRLYRTGDIGRMRHDGQLMYLGRTDNQIKLRGYRIEIEEIEAQLMALTGIKHTAVFCQGEGAAKHLIAYVYIDSGLKIKDIQFSLSQVLPAYMIPSVFRLIKDVPFTRNGKLDRESLRTTEVQTQAEETIEASALEKAVLELWKNTLKVKQTQLTSNFFHNGGNSLTAIRLLAKVQNNFDVSIDAADFLTNPTPAYLTQLIEQNEVSEKIERLTPRARNSKPVLSLNQERMWLLQQLSQGEAINNISAGLHFIGTLNKSAIKDALVELIESHQIFRTQITNENGVPVLDFHDFDWQMNSQSSVISDKNKAKELIKLVNLAASEDFNLANDWLIRAKLYSIAEHEHLLVLCVHHIISDGWSIGLMLSELSQRYADKISEQIINIDIEGQTTKCENVTKLQYYDYAQWQQNLVGSPLYQNQVDYWCNKLKDIPPAVSLPFKSKTNVKQLFKGKDCSVELSGELYKSIEKFAAVNHVSPFAVLFTAFHALVARLNMHNDLTIGIPSAGRNHQDTQNMLGFFVNTLAIRYQWGQNDSFNSAVKKMAKTISGALSHQDIPYDKVINAVKPAHGRGDEGLFNVFFNMLNLPSLEFNLPELKHQIIHADDSAAKFDLTLYLKECEEGMSVRARFNALNFEYSQISELLIQYESVLKQAIVSPEAEVNSWNLYTDNAQSIIRANESKSPDFNRQGIIEYFEHQVSRNPELTAISTGDRSISYESLSQQVNKLALEFLSQELNERPVIAIYADRSTELIVAILATLKINGIFVVLDSSYPTDTIQSRLKSVQPDCIVKCKAKIPSVISAYLKVQKIPQIDSQTIEINNKTIEIPDFNISPTDTAYYSFTSGTTGHSKVVMGTHRGLERAYLNWCEQEQDIDPGTRFSFLSGLGHDPLHRDIFLALGTGGTICIPGSDDVEPLKLGKWFIANSIEVANLTPAMLSLLLLDKNHRFSTLQKVMCVGEALPWSLVQELKAVSNADVYNLYGTTETQQCLARYHCPVNIKTSEGFVPIGLGFAGTQVIPVRPDGNPSGIGEIGEIAVISDGVSQGYLNSDDQAFFKTNSGLTGYRTGDQGMLLSEGYIRLIGRSDRQMTIRGYRVEPAEIERSLVSIPGIDFAYVCKQENQHGQVLLLAYIKSDEPQKEQHIMETLQSQLAIYQLPSSIIQITSIPRTPNGKIDELALPLPSNQCLMTELSNDNITNLIAYIWADVLKIEQPTSDVDFFQLGGHSLLAARVIAHIQSDLKVTVSLKEFFHATQLSQLSQLIKTKLKNNQHSTLPIIPVDRNVVIPLSLQQNRLWILQQLSANKSLYNISGAFRLHGQVNTAALNTAFNQLIQRHEILTTSFLEANGKPFQYIEKEVSFEIIEQTVQDQNISTLIKQEAQGEFDIAKAPLVRVKLLTMENDQSVLLITFHHLVFDGWSWGVLINEITQNYNAVLNKTSPLLPTLPVQFADFAHWQRNNTNSDHLSKQLDYWVKQLNGLPPLLHLPAKQPRPARQRFQGDLINLDIGGDRLQKLLRFSQSHGVTIHMTLLSIFQVLLAKLSGQHDIAVGTPVANRSHKEIENLIGFFVNTLVVRNKVDPAENFLLVLERLKENMLAAYENQDIPFEQIVEAIQPERSLSNSPLFQVLFSLQNAPTNSANLNDIEITSEPYQSHSSRFDLVLNLQQSENSLSGYLEYDIDLFEKETVLRWSHHYITLIDGILEEANRPIHKITMLSPQDQIQLQRFSNGPYKTIDSLGGIHGLISAQVLKHPDAIAIIQGQHTITYRELNDKADIIARWLQASGLKSGNRIGLNLVRKPEFFIIMLAILKAGGCYVPIDPTYPIKRQKTIAEDADLFLLISDTDQSIDHIDCLSVNDLFNQSLSASDLSELKQYEDYTDFAAYMIYTSGSTGLPKGVSVQHGGLCNMIVDQIDTFGIDNHDRVLQFASLSFDVSVKEIFLALASGAGLVLPEKQSGKLLLESLQTELKCQNVTVAILLPTVLPHLNPDALPDLRLVYTGAEAVSAQMANLWSQERQFVNAYGPTECTVMATAYECSSTLTVDPPIGKPIANNHVVVLSEYDECCGIGVAGEICIMGPGVTGSYWRQNEINNSRFTEYKFNGDNQLMYRTGDIGRWNEDGNLEFIGRRDTQVKIRGFRIEIDEVVATLQQCKGVNEIVVVVDKKSDHPRLLAYFVGEATVDILQVHAKSILPAHMIPSAFMQLDAIPYTTNFKVDYSRLPDIKPVESQINSFSPGNELEEILLTSWSQALGISQLGLLDNFFEKGGDSILALQAVSLCKQKGVEITAQQIFKYQTIAELISVCQIGIAESMLKKPVTGIVQLAPIQKWFFNEVQQHNSWFNQGVILRLKQDITGNDIINSFKEIIQHHDILRAQYEKNNNQWQQVIPSYEDSELNFIEKDLSNEFIDSGSDCITEFCTLLQSNFNLAEGPLFTAALVHLQPGETRLIIFAHHLIIDGVSWRIIIEDLQSLCLGKPLLPNTDSYQDYSNQCHALLADPEWTNQRQYWQDQLSVKSDIPLDKSGENTVGSSQNLSYQLTVSETNNLLQTASMSFKLNVTDILITAFLQTLQQWCGNDSISINIESHGRNAFDGQVNLTRTVGWCTSLYPLAFNFTNSASDEQLLKNVKKTIESVPNQGLGFGLLEFLSELPVTNKLQKMPEVGFNYLGQFDQTFTDSIFEPAPESTGYLSHKDQIRTQKLSVNALVKNNRMKINWIYSQNLHNKSTINSLADQFNVNLKRLLRVCQSNEKDKTSLMAENFIDVNLNQDELDDLFENIDY